ncbi:MAG: translocation/assembly module TamB domain-containing protein [Candidatus Cryptobacteroides sp.]
MKKFLHILKILIVVIAAIIAAVFIAIQAPSVQSLIAEKAASKLQSSTEAKIVFSHIHFKPFTQLVIDDLAVIDTAPVAPEPGDIPIDTLFRAGNISVRFSLASLLGGEGLHFSQARIRNAQMNLVLEDEQVNLGRMFGLEAEEDTTATVDRELFSIGDVRIENMGYSMFNYGPDRTVPEGTWRENGEQVGIDWTDLEVKNINLKGKNLKMRGKVIGGNLLEMSFTERSGFNCRHISGDVRAGNGNVIIRNLKIRDDYSDLTLPLFAMRYAGAPAFADFLNQVHLEGRIDDSFLDFKTLTFFAPTLENTGLRARVSGQVSGPVCNMLLKNVRVNMDDGSFAGTVNGRISNIPDIYEMRIDARLSACMFSSRGVDRLVNAWTEERIDFRKFAKGQRFMMDCNVEGRLNHLRVMPYISSLDGNMDADLKFSHLIDPDRAIQLKGHIRSKDLDAGKIAGIDAVGPVSLDASASLVIPVDGASSMSAHIDSLKISRLNLLGYDYQGIAAAGDITSDFFDGKLICNDPNLSFLFQGIFTLVNDKNRGTNSLWKFYANIGHADLHALKLDSRPVSRLRLRTAANFTTNENREINGKINIEGVSLENREGTHNIGNIEISADLKDHISRMKLKSQFLNGTFTGSASPIVFLDDIKAVTIDRDLPVLSGKTKTFSGNRYEVNFDFSDSRDLFSFLAPGFYIADGSSARLRLDSKGIARLWMKSQRIAYKDKFLKNFDAELSNADGSLGGTIYSNLVTLGPTISMDEARLSLYAADNNIGLGFNYGETVEDGNDGEVLALGSLGRDKAGDLSVQLDILPSGLRINSVDWDINAAELSMADGHIRIDGFGFTSGDQGLRIDGCIDRSGGDTLRVEMERFGIGLLNPLLPDNMQLNGNATGAATFISPLGSPDLNLDLVCDSTSIGGVHLGLLSAKCRFDKTFKRFEAEISNLYREQVNLEGRAFYTPSAKMLEAEASFDGFDLAIAKPFVGEIFNEIGGGLSGSVRFDSVPGRFRISSENLYLDDGLLSLLFTNVPYTVSGPIEIDTEGAHFRNISLKDRENGTGTLDGSILFGGFKNPELNLNATVNNLECLNVTQKQSPYFYGHIYGSGSARIKGPFSALVLDIDATTEKNGDLHIPIPNTSTAGNNDLLRFKGIEMPVKVDPYEEMMKKIKDIEARAADFSINLRVNATPGVTAYIEIDKASGNVLSARGSGLIELNSSSQNFEINGDYNISGGNYKFVALGIASRDFEIKEGSTIKFNGDIMDSNLNIDAVYKTKASLSTLIADTTSVNTRRSVECGIQITDKLRNPRIGFSIDVPDIDPTVKSKVESALSTQDKVQKQFLSLIISNAFLPDEQSGIFNTSTILASNVSEVMSGQLNNILQRLNIPLDLGLNYQPNDRGNDVFDVAVSTQLFNNRVIVNGNIGNRQYKTSGSNTDIVGDIEIEIKLDRKGSWRLNLFSHSADQYTNYLDYSQRNGVGMAYQVEFNGINDEDRKDLKTISLDGTQN